MEGYAKSWSAVYNYCANAQPQIHTGDKRRPISGQGHYPKGSMVS